MIIIKKAQSTSTISEAEIATKINEIKKNPPPGLNIYNPEMVKEFAIGELTRERTPIEEEIEQEEKIVPTIQPSLPKQQLTLFPAQKEETEEPQELEELHGKEQEQSLAQQLLNDYRQIKILESSNKISPIESREQKEKIIEKVLSIPKSTGGTIRNWMKRIIDQAGGKTPFPQTPTSPETWAYSVLEDPKTRDLLGAISIRKKWFIPRGSKLTKFKKYFDEHMNVKEEEIPSHLKDPNFLFFLLKARMAKIPSGDPGQIGKSSFGRTTYKEVDVGELIQSFPDWESVQKSTSPEAKLLKEYFADLQVSEAYKWDELELKGKYNNKSIIPSGDRGSRSYNAIENLNEIYKILSKKFNLPDTVTQEDVYKHGYGQKAPSGASTRKINLQMVPKLIVDPLDHTLQSTTYTYKTESRGDLFLLRTMMKNIKPFIGRKDIEEEINKTLPENKKISLKKEDYDKGGRLFIDDKVIGTSNSETGPTYISKFRQPEQQKKDIFIPTKGEDEGKLIEIEDSESKFGPAIKSTIEKPDINNMLSDPDKLFSGESGAEISRAIETDEDQIPSNVFTQIQNSIEKLFTTYQKDPPIIPNELIYALDTSHDPSENIVTKTQKSVELLKSFLKDDFFGETEDPLSNIKTILHGGVAVSDENQKVKHFDFDVELIDGRYLYVEPKTTDPKDKREAVIKASALLDSLSNGKLFNIYDEQGTTSPLDDKLKKEHKVESEALNARKKMSEEMLKTKILKQRKLDSSSISPRALTIAYNLELWDLARQNAEETMLEPFIDRAVLETMSEYAISKTDITNKMRKVRESPPAGLDIDNYTEVYEFSKNELINEMLKNRKQDIRKQIEDIKKAKDSDLVLKQLRKPDIRIKLFKKVIKTLYDKPDKEVMTELLSEWGSVPGDEKIREIKNSIAYSLLEAMEKDPRKINVDSITEKLQLVPQFWEYMPTILSRSELRSGAGSVHGAYKLINSVIGEIVGELIKNKEEHEISKAILNFLKMCKFAISARLMTKVS